MNFDTLSLIAPGLLDSGVSFELQSSPGLGKSEWADQLRAYMSKRDGFEWGMITMMLATQSATDLIGYQFKGERRFENYNPGRTTTVTDPTMPLWMQTDDGRCVYDFKRGILFLDEFGQGEPEVKRAAAELLLNRRIGPWKLPDGWSVISASNRAQDRSGVTKSFDFVINRRLQFEVTPDVASWENWANKAGIDPLFVSFAVANPQVVFEGKVPDKQGPWCTPRSLVKLAQAVSHVFPQGMSTDAVGIETAAAAIGEAAAQQLIAHIKLAHELPSFDQIVSDPEGTKIPTKPDAQMIAVYQLSSRVDAKTAKPVLTYVDRLPKEFAATFAKSVCQRIPAIVMTDAFSQWATRNATLVNMLHAA